VAAIATRRGGGLDDDLALLLVDQRALAPAEPGPVGAARGA
jgi:hypothetical protein